MDKFKRDAEIRKYQEISVRSYPVLNMDLYPYDEARVQRILKQRNRHLILGSRPCAVSNSTNPNMKLKGKVRPKITVRRKNGFRDTVRRKSRTIAYMVQS